MKSLIVGNGRVGQALSLLLSKNGWQNDFFLGRGVTDDFVKKASSVDVVFLTISTKDKGQAALLYAVCVLGLRKTLVTCEKGLFSYHFRQVKLRLNCIGYSAIVGGESGIAPFVASLATSGISEMFGTINATINFLTWAIQQDMPPEIALAEAHRLGLPEPGLTSFEAVYNREKEDAMAKAAIVWNSSSLGMLACPDDFSHSAIAESEILRLMRCKPHGRFVLRIRKIQSYRRPSLLDGFCLSRKPWVVFGSFESGVDNEFEGLSSDGPNNVFVVQTGQRKHMIGGIGAGPEVVASTMLRDAKRLLKIE